MTDTPLTPGALTPIFEIYADGAPVPPARVMRIEVTDAAGFESDEMTLTLDDAPPQIARPDRPPARGRDIRTQAGLSRMGQADLHRHLCVRRGRRQRP